MSAFSQVDLVLVSNCLNLPISDLQRSLLTLRGLGEIQLTWNNHSFCCAVLRTPDDMNHLVGEIQEFARYVVLVCILD